MKDGEEISKFMQDSTSNLRSVGRTAIYAIIATSWALSVEKGVCPNPTILSSLFFAVLYLAADFWYFYYSAYKYKNLLEQHFEPLTDGDMEYLDKEKNEKKVKEETKDIMKNGARCVSFMAGLLFLSFLFLLISLVVEFF